MTKRELWNLPSAGRLNVEIISTGGTSRLLASNGISVREVSDLTGFPEILDGRVKTLNPRIAGGLLAVRDNAEHMQQVSDHQLSLIDLVCVNLYPFVQTINKPGVHFEEVIENIDIGGPSMIRAAAKNFQDVAIVTSPDEYVAVAQSLKEGHGVLSREILFDLSQKGFLCTARYDSQIAQYLSKKDRESIPSEHLHGFREGRGSSLWRKSASARRLLQMGWAARVRVSRGETASGKGAVLQQHCGC